MSIGGKNVRRVSLLLAALLALQLSGAHADVLSVDFESYSTGTIDGQDGWSSAGAAGSGCAVYDHAVVDNTGAPYSYPSFGSKSLRISNAVTSGCFGDQTFSKSLANEAGETDAENGGLSGGTRVTHFAAQWQFASTVPSAEQPDLSVVASPDRGDGARMSWVQMKDTPGGLEVNFFDYQSGAVEVGCVTGDNFIFSNVASGLDRTVPHTIRINMDLIDGTANDVVRVYVDGVLMHTGTSWEDFFRECEGTPGSRTVDSILFRTGGAPAPATLGMGFLIDDFSLSSSSGTPTTVTVGVSPSFVHVDDSATFSATVLDENGNPAPDGTAVTWDVTHPDSHTDTLGPVSTSGGTGQASLLVPANAPNQQYGTYSLVAKAGSATSAPTTFEVGPLAPATIGSVAVSNANPASGTPVTVTASNIEDTDGHPAKFDTAVTFTVTDPSSVVSAYAGVVSGGAHASDPLSATATIPGSTNTIGGTYVVDVTTSPGTATGSVSYLVPLALTLANPATVALGQYADVSVSGIPAAADRVSLEVTPPAGPPVFQDPITYTPGGSTATFRLDPSVLSSVGAYGLEVSAFDPPDALVGIGTGTIGVVGTTMTFTITPSSVSSQGPVTLKATIKRVDTLAGVPGVSVSFIARWLSTLSTASASAFTNPSGDAVYVASGFATLLPGDYTASAASGPHSASGTFTVTLP